VVEQRARARVILVGGDARLLRALRLFLDSLGIFDAVAVATAGAGLNALTRQPWGAAVVVDDLRDMASDQLVATARSGGFDAPVVGLITTGDRARLSALYEAGAVEVLQIGAAPTPDLARALARAIERQELINRIEQLEGEAQRRQVVDAETGLYASWRFEEDWRLEQVRAKRRAGDLSVLAVTLETTPPIVEMSARDRTTTLRVVARALRGAMREGDFASHDGGGMFRVLLSDAGSLTAAQEASKISTAIRGALQANGIAGTAMATLLDSFESVATGGGR
jgi:PleD family two-component response regulator